MFISSSGLQSVTFNGTLRRWCKNQFLYCSSVTESGAETLVQFNSGFSSNSPEEIPDRSAKFLRGETRRNFSKQCAKVTHMQIQRGPTLDGSW